MGSNLAHPSVALSFPPLLEGGWECIAAEILSLKSTMILGSDFPVVKPLSIQGTRSMALLQEKSFENHK